MAVVFPPIVRQSGFLASRQINKNKDKEIPELDGEWQNEELPKLNLLDVSEAGGVEDGPRIPIDDFGLMDE